MITNISNDLKKCGIYKITYTNGKIYIGQSLSIYKRALEHNAKNIYPCDRALQKYDATIEILEQIDDILILDERETYWINFYDATNKTKGYNLVSVGNASNKKGTDNKNASLNKQQLLEVIQLLQNDYSLSYQDIASRYNVSSATIQKICYGETYVDLNLSYPLRKNNHQSANKQLLDYFQSKDQLIALKDDLYYRWDLEMEDDLSKIYSLPVKVVREINLGKKFQEYGNYTYPIRKKNIRNNNNFTQEIIINILEDLKNTNLSMSKIGEKYNLHRDTVSKINKGLAYPIKDFIYPARQ